ncbi:hypothetical protein Aduo_016074 [Ancylostoma duodenale]
MLVYRLNVVWCASQPRQDGAVGPVHRFRTSRMNTAAPRTMTKLTSLQRMMSFIERLPVSHTALDDATSS